MDAQTKATVLSLIRQIKPDDMSDLDAAINIIESHAATIRQLTKERDDAIAGLLDINGQLKSIAETLQKSRES